jgi:hypothetical protein
MEENAERVIKGIEIQKNLIIWLINNFIT